MGEISFFGPYLGSVGSSMMHLALIAGLWFALPPFVSRTSDMHRSLLFLVSFVLASRYGWWRATETLAPLGFTIDCLASWSFFMIEMFALVGSMSSFVIMSRFKDRSPEADANISWWLPGDTPRVAILIATYNEDLEILERTIIGAKSLRHPNTEVIVLDDSRRDWLRDYCAEQGVRYMRRPDNKGSKAGNINHALDRLAEDPVQPDFIAVLDADFIPHRGFLSRSLALFHDPKVALVQTPQHFFNADPIQHNLGLSRSYPDEQRFFFDHMQPSRDGWGVAICCGTSSICRWSALRDLGGLPTESVTEDFLLTLAFQERGWKTVYLSEALSEGLAPEGLKEYVTQRARWCLGLMQIARSRFGPLGRNNLRFRDRWSVTDSVFYWMTSFPFRIAAVVYPLLYWYFGTIVVDASLPDVLSYFGCYFVWSLLVMRILMPGMFVPILHDASQLIGAIPISRAAFTGLFKPKGHPFSVTAKGGDRSKVQVQWAMMRPFLIFFALTLGGLMIGIYSDSFAFNDAGTGKVVILFWTVYNLVVLFVTMIACIELPREEAHIADEPERAIFVTDDVESRVWIVNLTRDTVRIRGRIYEQGTRGQIIISGLGSISAQVISSMNDGARLQMSPTKEQFEQLYLRFYATDNTPGVASVRTRSMMKDVAKRFSFISRER